MSPEQLNAARKAAPDLTEPYLALAFQKYGGLPLAELRVKYAETARPEAERTNEDTWIDTLADMMAAVIAVRETHD
jgi:hypothetical protein